MKRLSIKDTSLEVSRVGVLFKKLTNISDVKGSYNTPA